MGTVVFIPLDVLMVVLGRKAGLLVGGREGVEGRSVLVLADAERLLAAPALSMRGFRVEAEGGAMISLAI